MFKIYPLNSKFRSLLVGSMILTLGLGTFSCDSPIVEEPSSNQPQTSAPQTQTSTVSESEAIPADGQYGVQQVTYDDATGEYAVQLLNTSPGEPSLLRTDNLPMARLTDAEIDSGKDNYLKVEQGQPSLHVAKDFQIEYVHNVTEATTNPQTGQAETVVVRRETGFWAPFAGALAGQALGSLLFTPHYYMPPVYQPGGVLVGYGGYGRTYNQAVTQYQTRYKAPPAEVRNRQTLRTSGQVRSRTSTSGQSTRTGSGSRSGSRSGQSGSGQSGTNRRVQQSDRPSGSGYGSDTLQRNRSGSSTYQRRSGSGFGSRSSGSRRRRR